MRNLFNRSPLLELGSSAGVSGSYLASAPACGNFITIERSHALAKLSEHNIRQVNAQSHVINGRFDDVLENVLNNLTDQIDLVNIDGPKNKLKLYIYSA